MTIPTHIDSGGPDGLDARGEISKLTLVAGSHSVLHLPLTIIFINFFLVLLMDASGQELIRSRLGRS